MRKEFQRHKRQVFLNLINTLYLRFTTHCVALRKQIGGFRNEL